MLISDFGSWAGCTVYWTRASQVLPQLQPIFHSQASFLSFLFLIQWFNILSNSVGCDIIVQCHFYLVFCNLTVVLDLAVISCASLWLFSGPNHWHSDKSRFKNYFTVTRTSWVVDLRIPLPLSTCWVLRAGASCWKLCAWCFVLGALYWVHCVGGCLQRES